MLTGEVVLTEEMLMCKKRTFLREEQDKIFLGDEG